MQRFEVGDKVKIRRKSIRVIAYEWEGHKDFKAVIDFYSSEHIIKDFISRDEVGYEQVIFDGLANPPPSCIRLREDGTWKYYASRLLPVGKCVPCPGCSWEPCKDKTNAFFSNR